MAEPLKGICPICKEEVELKILGNGKVQCLKCGGQFGVKLERG